MNYLLEINAFERRMRGHPLPTTAQLLWYKLMQFANRLYWPEWFSIDNDRLTATVNAGSDKTIRIARQQLVDAGLLQFEKGVKGRPSRYKLIPVTTIEAQEAGQSHSPAIGMSLSGLPAGFAIDMDELSAFLRRRAPGQNAWSTPRKEADAPEFLSGLVGNVTCGAPLSAIIRNTNTRSQDYSNLVDIPRPGHADYTAQVKFGGFQDVAGGGHFSGRLTAPLCIAGGICKQLLHEKGIEVMARIDAVAGIQDTAEFDAPVAQKDFPVTSDEAAGKMKAAIAQARAEEDSVGGVIQCRMLGVPAGLGAPMFGGLENRISQLVFAIPAVKGIEFGLGFEAAKLRGSENNDAYHMENGSVVTETNHCGGILGGISNGMPIVFRAAVKPTPSIGKPQNSVRLSEKQNEVLHIHGRHDPCIVPRAVPCMEAAAAIAIFDALAASGTYRR